jgi:flagella basal body P-ring formation protein FlgA
MLCSQGAVLPVLADLNDLLKPVPGAQSVKTPVRERANPAPETVKQGVTTRPEAVPVSAGTGSSSVSTAVISSVASKELAENELVDAIQKDLLRRFPSLGELKVNLSRPWRPLVLASPDFFAECLQLPGNGLGSNMSFSVRIVSGGRILGEFPVQARVELWQEVWVSSQRLDKGQVLDRGMLNTVKLDVLREYVPPLTVDQDYVGFELSQPLTAGRPLTRRDIVERTVVKRGQIVEAVASEGPIRIRMRAQAMEAGPAGAVIRVKNVDSQKEFIAQVINENQVQVRF